MDLIGALSSAAGGAAGGENLYIEDVFSTYLYTGNGSTQTITNGIDLDGEGGLVWIKNREEADSHILTDTERGATEILSSDSSAAEATDADTLTAFNSDGFALGADVKVNTSTEKYVSWTFRKAPKFFDIVTYTGTGAAGLTVPHNLGSVPGCIIVKGTSGSNSNWRVYHRANTADPETEYLQLNGTGATSDLASVWNDTAPTDTEFTVGDQLFVNASGVNYVAYLWAHDDGGFGDDGLQNVVSCGSFTTDASGNATVTLGYEPQWVIIKRTDGAGGWWITDTMRGMTVVSGDNVKALFANSSNAEADANQARPNATGFTVGPSGNLSTSASWVYIAIRRGPMKTPTAGTEVFAPFIGNSSSGPAYVSNFVVDTGFDRKFGETDNMDVASRLTGANKLVTSSSAAETADGDLKFDYMTGYYSALRNSEFVSWMFRRAPSFMDVVCYTGTGLADQTFNHNLQEVPELIIVKSRNNARPWPIYSKSFATGKYAFLNDIDPESGPNIGLWNYGTPTSTVFPVGAPNDIGGTIYPPINTNGSGYTYVAYLFATCAGVSKVGSYTGTGTTKQIDCGFTAGARFVLIKRTDSTGDWYVWDTARGIVSGDDPYLELNTTDAEVTNTDYIDPLASGFEITSTAPAAINASGGTFIFLAIA
jgi:hypothetical protein